MLNQNLINYARTEADHLIRRADVLYVLFDVDGDAAKVTARYINGDHIQMIFEE